MKQRVRLPLAAGILLGITSTVLAQGMSSGADDPPPSGGRPAAPAAPKEIRPPAPAEPDKAPIAVPYLLTFALAGAAVGLAVFPSGRTHQD